MQYRAFDDGQLQRFRAAQRASFKVLEDTAVKLSPGITERDATTSMLRAFQALGIRSYFHLPVALLIMAEDASVHLLDARKQPAGGAVGRLGQVPDLLEAGRRLPRHFAH